MEEISLIEAWGLWWSGVDIADRKLWGLEILWWGRIGKLSQFLAACFILIEIIGVDAVKNFIIRFSYLAEAQKKITKNMSRKIFFSFFRNNHSENKDDYIGCLVSNVALLAAFVKTIQVIMKQEYYFYFGDSVPYIVLGSTLFFIMGLVFYYGIFFIFGVFSCFLLMWSCFLFTIC